MAKMSFWVVPNTSLLSLVANVMTSSRGQSNRGDLDNWEQLVFVEFFRFEKQVGEQTSINLHLSLVLGLWIKQSF